MTKTTLTKLPKLTLENQTKYFNSQKTKDIGFRINQLKILKNTILNNEDKIIQALQKDLGKNQFEAYTTEIGFVYQEISHNIKNLKDWAKPQKVSSNKTFPLTKNYIISEPLGKILIIGPWNYPFQLAIMPLIGAIASGNVVTIKPSEISKHTSQILSDIITKNFDKNYIQVIQGDVKITTQILELNFDYIFFTGSENVGKIIMKKAAETLTPVTLELGGKSPTIIDKECDINKAANRIIYGKFTNAGQTCIAPDYLLLNSQIKTKFIQTLQEKIIKFYTKNPETSKDYGKIINENHFERIISYLENQKIIFGGNTNKSKLYIQPTLINLNKITKQKINKNIEPKIMQEEIFGPLLPILEYNNIQQAIDYINSKPKPLALYIFTDNEYIENKILNETSSGSVCINDTIIQISNPELPFGGVGNSGFGKYHGKSTFDTFSNKKTVLKNTTLFEIPKRYPPYNNLSLKIIKKIFK